MRILRLTEVTSEGKPGVVLIDDLGSGAVFGSLHRDGGLRIFKLLVEGSSLQLKYDRIRYLPVVNMETGEVGAILKGTVVTPYSQVLFGLEEKADG